MSISLSLFGVSYAGTSASGSDQTLGLITTQTPGTISAVLAAAGTPGGFQDSYSATLFATSNVPEPGSFLALGSGLLLLSAGFLRRKVRS